MTTPIRKVFSWKFGFYELLLPALRRLGPAKGDRALGALGKAFALACPGRRQRLRHALGHASEALSMGGPLTRDWLEFGAGSARFLARDYMLDVPGDAHILERFEVHGREHLSEAMEAGRGVMLVGSHFGAHLAGLHWLYRSGMPVNALVQRPAHISDKLSELIDARLALSPAHDLFLRRGMEPAGAVELLLRARSALRRGEVVYACGDIPWEGPNCRQGRLLGRDYPFLSIWTDLAVLMRVPTFHQFCVYLPDGKFRLEVVPVGPIRAGEEPAAVERYLRNLEGWISNYPSQAIAHLLWPCYSPVDAALSGAGRGERKRGRLDRPSRQNAPRNRRDAQCVDPRRSPGSIR